MPDHSPHKNFKSIDRYSVYFARASNVLDQDFQIRVSILSTLLLFYALRFFDILIIDHKNFLYCRLFSVFVARTSNVLDQGYQIMVSILSTLLLLYTPFLRHSILNHQALSFATIITKNVERCFNFSHVLVRSVLRFLDQVSIISTLLLFYSLRFFEILF